MKKTLLVFAFMLFATLIAPNAHAVGRNVYVDVNGLVCDFCARSLEKVFKKQVDVTAINVNLDSKVVTVALKEDAKLDDEGIAKLIKDSGYSVVKIRHDGEVPTNVPADATGNPPDHAS